MIWISFTNLVGSLVQISWCQPGWGSDLEPWQHLPVAWGQSYHLPSYQRGKMRPGTLMERNMIKRKYMLENSPDDHDYNRILSSQIVICFHIQTSIFSWAEPNLNSCKSIQRDLRWFHFRWGKVTCFPIQFNCVAVWGFDHLWNGGSACLWVRSGEFHSHSII